MDLENSLMYFSQLILKIQTKPQSLSPEYDILKLWHINLTALKDWGGCGIVCAQWHLFA